MSRNAAVVANVTEAGDIVLYAIGLVVTLLVGLALLGIDAAVGRLSTRRGRSAGDRSSTRERGG